MVVPKMRFKTDSCIDFSEWETKRADELFESITDKNHPEDEVLTIIQGHGTVPRNKSGRNIQYDDKGLIGYKRVQKNDFIIHLRSFEGGLEIANENGIVSPAYIILRGKCDIAPGFYNEYFHTNRFINQNLAKAVEGIRDGRQISYNTFCQLNIPYPCIEEQNKIATLFSTLNTVIANCQSEVDAWEKYKRGVMQQLFSQKVRFKADDGSEYPDWGEKSLGTFCDIVTKQTGFDYTATIKPSLLRKPERNALPYLQTKNFSGVEFDYNTDYFIPEKIANNFPKIILDRKCVLFSIVGASVGNVALFPATTKCFLSGAICVAKTIFEDDATYIYYFMTSQEGQRQIFNMTKGGAQATITIEDIRNITINIPRAKEEQHKIADCLSAFDEVIDKAKQKLEAYKQLKKGLLQQMFV